MSLDTSVASAPSPRPVATRRGLLAGILGTAAGHRFAPAMAAAQSWGTPLRTAAPGVAQGGEASSGTRPNIVLILLDDLDAEGVAHMPSVRALLEERGTSFANFFVTTPVCGPARASLLRGQYAHNHGMQANTGANGGFSTFHRLGRQASTVAVWLEAAGYRTAYFGKYLNGFPKGVGARDVPPGWVEWFGLASKQPSYFDYELNENGRLVAYGQDVEDYSTDVLAGKVSDFVRRTLATGNPFFACVAPLAPHWPAVPAPRHAERFVDEPAPRSPSFNETDTGDKPQWVRETPELSDDQILEIDAQYRQRIRSLQAVDEMVATLVETLEIGGGLENTVLLVTSDNGSFAGEHRLAAGKQAPYEEAIRVPLLVRGPGIAAKHSVAALALNVDLAPTIADLAGVIPPDFVDGRSLVPQLRGEQPAAWRQAFLGELFSPIKANDGGSAPGDSGESGAGASEVPPYRAVRTADLLYVEYGTGEREFYDLRTDPAQLDNTIMALDPDLQAHLTERLERLTTCAGTTCRTVEDAPLDLPLPAVP